MAFIDLSSNNLVDPVSTNLNKFAHNLPNAAVTAVAGFVAIRIVSWVASWLIGFVRMPKGLKEIVVSLIDALLTIILVIVTLEALGLDNVAFIVTAAVAGLGIAMGNGSVTLVSDILAGIYLARDRDFSVGDIVQAGENQVQGEIVSMDMRRTRIRDAAGAVHSLPNSVVERKEYILITKKRDRTDLTK